MTLSLKVHVLSREFAKQHLFGPQTNHETITVATWLRAEMLHATHMLHQYNTNATPIQHKCYTYNLYY